MSAEDGNPPPSAPSTTQPPAPPAQPPGRIAALLDRRAIRIACGVLGGLLIIGALLVFGVWGAIRSLVSAFSGQTLAVLVLLVLGTLLAAVALLGGQIGSLPKNSIIGSLQWILTIIGYLLAAWLVLTNQTFFSGGQSPTEASARWQGIALGVISVLFLLVVTVLMARSETLAKTFSNNTSTAPTVVMLWSIVVVYAIAFIAAIALTSNNPGDLQCPTTGEQQNCVVASAWSDYLLLLGLPGVAAAIAKSSAPEDNLNSSSLTNDKITEIQFFVFNAIAMIFVLWSLATRGVLGEIPDVLLGLTGASALTFSLAKRLPAATQ